MNKSSKDSTRRASDAAFQQVYRKIDFLEDRLTSLNDIAAQANQSIRQGRFDELPNYQGLLQEMLQNSRFTLNPSEAAS